MVTAHGLRALIAMCQQPDDPWRGLLLETPKALHAIGMRELADMVDPSVEPWRGNKLGGRILSSGVLC